MKLVVSMLLLMTMLLTSISGMQRRGSKAAPGDPELAKKIRRFSPTVLTADTSRLSATNRKALQKIIDAARLLDPLFLRQVWAGGSGTISLQASATFYLPQLTPVPATLVLPTATPSPTLTSTPLPTATPTRTATPSPTATITPVPATATPTSTLVPSTATPTSLPTATPTPSVTPSVTPPPTPTVTPTPRPTPTPRSRPTPRPRPTPRLAR